MYSPVVELLEFEPYKLLEFPVKSKKLLLLVLLRAASIEIRALLLAAVMSGLAGIRRDVDEAFPSASNGDSESELNVDGGVGDTLGLKDTSVSIGDSVSELNVDGGVGDTVGLEDTSVSNGDSVRELNVDSGVGDTVGFEDCCSTDEVASFKVGGLLVVGLDVGSGAVVS